MSHHDNFESMKTALEGCIDVSRETRARLDVYHQLLVQWQKVQNLVAPNTLDQVWTRHFADSAQLSPLLDAFNGESKVLVDLGSGAGFPGLVLAILKADQPNFKVHLVEANGRKCAFLKDVARATGLDVDIHNCRIEDFANKSTIFAVDVVTARALKPLHSLLDLGGFAFQNGAAGLFLKGQSYAQEIEEALSSWSFEVECFESCTDKEGRIVKVTQIKPRSKGSVI